MNYAGYAALWERSVGGTMAFMPRAGLTPLTLKAENGRIADVETGSEWRVDGRAVSGPLEGQSLEPVEEAFVSLPVCPGHLLSRFRSPECTAMRRL